MSAHLFHQGDLDALVTGAVAPVVAEATDAGLTTGHFFLRYWEGGLHIRFRLRPARPEYAEPLRERIRERAGEHLRRHPSTPRISAEAYREFAAGLARGERLDRYESELRPNDSVQFVAYRPEHHAYGDDEAMTAVERHFTESSDLALRVLAAGVPADRRAAVALAATMSTLAVCEPDLPGAAARVAETLHREPAGTGPLWAASQAAFVRDRAGLRRQARSCWAEAATEAPPATRGTAATRGALATWNRSIRTLHDSLTTLWASGRHAPPDPGSPMGPLAAVARSERRTLALILLRCAHLLNNRLGLGLETEAQVGLIVARTLASLSETER
ncbi:hypothetical protein I0C86_32820 [Plantactinospora sp. S1510]|uniref:Thiopeptide-type bacteriocin biosynthesis domain-containing protein n=1 Tax=Plantactinospora alkalitolerans TaxID=2789879 RepID=A0ABS0H5F3_9ACTN|nr:lantibiotic dehydratase C-terminal domain-containing protein [Plantactinospora alkalitolerans]MBF9133683.1 hypothetical protein [Plantactinospora alkalitolerans]